MPKELQGLVEPKVLAIFTTLAMNPQKIYHLNLLATDAKVPVTSTVRIVQRLVKTGLVTEVLVGKLTLYTLAQTERVEKLKKLL